MYISRDVVFHETMFPFATTSSLTESYAAQPAPFIPPLHIPAHPTPFPTASNITSSPTSSHSSSAEPSVTHSHSNIEVTPSPHIHPMRTRAQNNIVQQRNLTDGTIRYPVPHALLSMIGLAIFDMTREPGTNTTKNSGLSLSLSDSSHNQVNSVIIVFRGLTRG
jgi:hypothetical protein